MATITLNDEAPRNEGPIRFSIGTSSEAFELEAGKSFETDDYDLVSSASVHPWLTVEASKEEPAEVETPEPATPQNPQAPAGIEAPVAPTTNGGRK